MRGLADFERELNEASTLEEKFEAIFKALILNTFTSGLNLIDQLNLATLEIRYPEVYEAVKDKGVREVLVRIGIFDVDMFKNSDRSAIELGFRSGTLGYPYLPFFQALHMIWEHKYKDLADLYGGPDAVKVLLKALHVLYKLMYRRDTCMVDEEKYQKLKA